MKKIFFFLFLIIPFVHQAQEFNAGLLFGIAPSQLDGDHFSGYHKLGYSFGGYVNRYFTKRTGMQFGIRFIEKGSRESDEKDDIFYRCVLRYAEIPVTYFVNFKKSFRFEIGATMGYLIQGKEAKGDNYLEDAYPSFRKYELGEIIGIQYKINDKFTIGIQHGYSITAVRPYSSNVDYMDYGQRNNILIFHLDYTMKSWRQ